MRIFLKYHLKEYFFYTFSFFIVFGAIITLVQGIIKLQGLLLLNPSIKVIFQFFILMYFELISFIYTLSAFMGVLFAIHRLKYEKEILGFCSLGFSLRDFLKPLIVFSTISFTITFLAHFFLLPWAKREIKLIKIDLIKSQIEKPFPEKRPISLGKEYSLYVLKSQKRKKKHIFKNIFLLRMKQAGKKGFFLAQEGSYIPKEDKLILVNGWGIFIDPRNNIEVLKFGDYQFRLNLRNLERKFHFSRGEKSFSELKKDLKRLKPGTSEYFRYFEEYYERFFFPLSVVFLILQAFFLGISIKTSHRFLLFFIGITIFLIFYIGYSFFASLGENGKLFPLWSYSTFYILMGFVVILQFLILKKKKEFYL